MSIDEHNIIFRNILESYPYYDNGPDFNTAILGDGGKKQMLSVVRQVGWHCDYVGWNLKL